MVGLAVAALRRSALLLAVALVTAVAAGAGMVDLYRIRHGPVATLATHRAVVSADLEIRADPHPIAGTGVRPHAAVIKAAVVRIQGRGGAWLVRAPVLLVVSGPQLGQWFEIPVGSRLAVDGRLDRPDRGSDLSAVMRVRGSPVVVEAPSPGLGPGLWKGFAMDCGRLSPTVARSRGRWCPLSFWATRPASKQSLPRTFNQQALPI